MSVEGGPFQCSITGEIIPREDVEGWNRHCQQHEGYHTFFGTSVCVECGAEIRFTKHPYIPLDPQSKHLKRSVRLQCGKHEELSQNPKGVQVELITGNIVEHKDTQKSGPGEQLKR